MALGPNLTLNKLCTCRHYYEVVGTVPWTTRSASTSRGGSVHMVTVKTVEVCVVTEPRV